MTEDPILTQELEAFIAKKIMENKPYLIEIEDRVNQVGFGTIDLRLEVRGRRVEKVEFYEKHSWLREKAKPVVPNSIDIIKKE